MSLGCGGENTLTQIRSVHVIFLNGFDANDPKYIRAGSGEASNKVRKSTKVVTISLDSSREGEVHHVTSLWG